MENAIRFAKKYYFWPVCLIALGLALFFWSSSTGALDKEFTSNESNYTQSKSSVDNIPSNPPNEKAIKAVERKKNTLMHNVFNAWELLYNRQNEHNQWPEIIINDRQVDFNADRISGEGAEQYRYRIVEEFKKMVETLHPISERDKNGIAIDDEIGRVAANMDSATAELANAVAETEKETTTASTTKKELVVWAEKDIDDLVETHFSWQRIPTTLQIRVAQEDFWIFKNIIDAIKTLNEGVDNRSSASLKEIRSLLIAGDAVEKFQARQETGFFDEKNFSKTSLGSEDDMREGGETSESGAEASAGGEGGEALKKEFRELYNLRYVDKNGKGLTAEQYNASINFASAGINASKTRNIPVYMSLVIKQNRLSDLMSLLTNAEKPVDIKLVLINPGQGWTPSFDFSRFEEASADGEGGEGAEGGSYSRPVVNKSSRSRGSRNNEHSLSRNENSMLSSDEIVVDIYGIISLFNVPSMEMFPDMAEGLNNSDNANSDDNADEAGDEENADAADNEDAE